MVLKGDIAEMIDGLFFTQTLCLFSLISYRLAQFMALQSHVALI